jgi:hypothetical protein
MMELKTKECNMIKYEPTSQAELDKLSVKESKRDPEILDTWLCTRKRQMDESRKMREENPSDRYSNSSTNSTIRKSKL